MDIEVKKLMWKLILSNLSETLGVVERLHQRLHFLTFGELPEDCHMYGDAACVACLKNLELRNPFNEKALFVGLKHAYLHLSRVWNCRCMTEEEALHQIEREGKMVTRFPSTADFADLWPSDKTVKWDVVGPQRKISLTPVRIFVHTACRKLRILCYLVAKELGEDRMRPKGLSPEVGAQPLTEKDFVRRMHRIYVELNMTWNSRLDKNFARTKLTIERRRLFPPIFVSPRKRQDG